MLEKQHNAILPSSFFDRPATEVAPDLLGRWLVREWAEGVSAGVIVETEAYMQDDPAFHAWGVVDPPSGLIKPTGRAYDLFGPPGTAYVYLCYGVHWLLNVVTEREGVPGCVLIRGLQPVNGIEALFRNRPRITSVVNLTNGPGKLTSAFGIDKRHHGTDITQPPLYFATPRDFETPAIQTSSRIGISRAVDRQWRYYMTNNSFVSPGTPSDVTADRRKKRRRAPL
ncbi:MAG: DNA-3-methyladenine glycosylase [Rhodothermales bacterium]|nr:DNA-3-methyladenine glycosylase [Rhodothermales bacterium]